MVAPHLSLQELELEQFKSISYLQRGSAAQKKAYQHFHIDGVIQKLKRYKATLCSPIALDLEGEISSCTVLCEITDPAEFVKELVVFFGRVPITIRIEGESVHADIHFSPILYRIVATTESVHLSTPFICMIIEARLLALGGEKMKEEVAELLHSGFTLEEAFSTILGLKGNPVERLYELASASNEMLEDIMQEKLDEWALNTSQNY